ncbi:MAG: M1 family aminopeptidase, partial [Kineosporiaceae bacterium]
MGSLGREEAVERAERVTVHGCLVDLDLAGDTSTFGSRSSIRFHSDGRPTFLDVAPKALRAVRLNGTALDAGALDGARFPVHPDPGENELVVEAVMGYRTDGEGLHRAVDPADGRHYVYAMSFLDAAPSIFACFDQPDLKAPYTLTVRTPPDWVAIGNAPGEQAEPGLWTFEPTPPLSTYHVALVAGPYHVVRDSTGGEGSGIALGLSARRSLAADLDRDVDELFAVTRQCFAEFHRLFAVPYPFGDYHQAFVPEFNAGAMESPGCVTFRDPLVFGAQVTRSRRTSRAVTVAHEMAHQWFGNLVTPRWWDDLWLNESFAEYMGCRVTAEATGFDDAWVMDSFARKQWGLIADQRPSTHPVAGNGAHDAATALANFDGISYSKGSALLKQLASSLGEAVFLGGVREHFARHRFANATMDDLFAAWESAGASELRGWTASWLRTAGLDRISLDRSSAEIVVEPPPGETARREHTFEVAVRDGLVWRRTPVHVAEPRTALPDGAGPLDLSTAAVVLDPGEQTWALTAPDPITVAALPRLLPGLDEPLMRAAVWNGLRSGVHTATVDPRAALAVVRAAIPVEDSDIGVTRVLEWALDTLAPASADPGATVAVVH